MSLALGGRLGYGTNPLTQAARFPLRHALAGAVTTTGFVVTACTFSNRASVSLQVATDSAFQNIAATVAGDMLTGNDFCGKWTVTGLRPGTEYFWRLLDGVTVGARQGRIRTYYSGAQSFTFCFASCNDEGEDPQTWTRILDRNPDFMLHMGDLHYRDITADSVSLNMNAMLNVLGQGRMGGVLGQIPLMYVPSDHDSGTNLALDTVKPAVHTVYRRLFPHYTLPAADAWYQAFTIGRCRFILLDTKSKASPSSDADSGAKTMLGATQQTWLEGELLAAKTANQVIFLMTNQGWCGGYSGLSQDAWYDYQFARSLILDYIVAQTIPRVHIIHGDMHNVVVDTGSYNTSLRGTLTGNLAVPVYCAAPFDGGSSTRGSGWDLGRAETVNGTRSFMYGTIQVTDTGGSEITVTFTGRRASDDAANITHTRVVTV